MKIFIMVLVLTMLAVPCFGEITPKVAITYNIDSEQIGEAVGGSVKEDILGIKNLDLDILVASEEVGDTLKDDDKRVINGISYNYDFTEKLSAGIGGGLELLEYSDGEIDLKERDKYLYCALSYKF